MQDLAGRVVLITGGARGMGRLHADNFAREGCRVVITDIDEAELQKPALRLELPIHGDLKVFLETLLAGIEGSHPRAPFS